MLRNQDMGPSVSSVFLLNNNVTTLVATGLVVLMQDAQVDIGNGPGAPGPDGGRHRPITAIYLAARSWITSLLLPQETLHGRRQYEFR